MQPMKIYTSLQKRLTTRLKFLGGAIFLKLFAVIAASVFILSVLVEFLVVEPAIYHSEENKGQAILDYFSKSVRNDLLSGYRGGLNVAAELLVSTGQCHYVKIYDSNQSVIASFPSEDFLKKENKLTKKKEIMVQWDQSLIHFSKVIFFDETMGSRVGTIQMGIDRETVARQVFMSRLLIFGWMLFLILITGLFLHKTVENQVVSPLSDLSKKIALLNERGIYPSLKETSTRYAEIEKIFSMSQTLIDRVKTAEDMIERKGAATAIGELMQDFSHGIRTPITVIKNRALDIALDSEKLISMKDVSEEDMNRVKQRLLLQKEAIIDESGKVETFVSRILDSTQPIDIHPAPTALYHLVEKVIEIYRSQPFQKKIVFLNQIDPNLPVLLLDRVYFEEVFDNLFSNSVYAIESNDQIQEGYIRIGSKLNSTGKILLSIEDNGCGIDERNLKMIFKPHFTTKKGRGNGRGLFIVQRILDKHQAFMTAESKLANGTTMTIHFGERGGHVH